IDLYEELLALPKPVVAAVSGHTVAGGAVLALTADQRVLGEGDYRFALNEVDLGLQLPPKVMRMLIAAVGFHSAAGVLMAGIAPRAHTRPGRRNRTTGGRSGARARPLPRAWPQASDSLFRD